MSRLEQRLIDGHRTAKEQRERLKLRAAATRDRLTPQRLLNDATTLAEHQVRTVARDAVAAVKDHPARTALIGGAALAWVFRHPLLDRGPAWIKRTYAVIVGHDCLTGESCSISGEVDDIDPQVIDADGGGEHRPDDIVQQSDSR